MPVNPFSASRSGCPGLAWLRSSSQHQMMPNCDRPSLIAAQCSTRKPRPAWASLRAGYAIMRVESASNSPAVSHAGAMRPMQIMPATWRELRARYGLGGDSPHPRDSILMGAAYLREMHKRFGWLGFVAAYNAVPERYRQYLVDGRPPRPARLATTSQNSCR
ncbi:lytic transglycosylase domain-containing protein [Tabrizicola sp.]|uniref:lytic transglycosylase domain-containing protein n=1 Tax=Tabrizicola sp. TaxID=2005166 RepID=UPI003F40381C